MKTLAVLLALALTATAKNLTVTWFEMPVHGLAGVLEAPSGKVFVIDAGGRDAKSGYDPGRDTIAPFLKAQGHAAIDGISISKRCA